MDGGGKQRLLPEIIGKMHEMMKMQPMQRYVEPFVGGGAVALNVIENFHPKEILINDLNQHLINTYIQVRDNIDELVQELEKINSFIESMNKHTDSKKYFYEKRKEFNTTKDNVLKAADMIYLTKNSFNGLWDENRKGEMNVPCGNGMTKANIEAVLKASELLQGVLITCGDYRECGDYINGRTCVYFDPPYLGSHRMYGSEFTEDNQKELFDFALMCKEKGAKILISHGDSDFIKNICKKNNFEIQYVQIQRLVAADNRYRNLVNELLIT